MTRMSTINPSPRLGGISWFQFSILSGAPNVLLRQRTVRFVADLAKPVAGHEWSSSGSLMAAVGAREMTADQAA